MSNKKEQSNNQEHLLPTRTDHDTKQATSSTSTSASARENRANKISGPQMFIITLVIALIAIIFLFPFLRDVMVAEAPPQPMLPSSFDLTPTPRIQSSDVVESVNPEPQVNSTITAIEQQGYRNSDVTDETAPRPILPTPLQPQTAPGVVAGLAEQLEAVQEVIPAEETFEFTLLSELSIGSQVWDLAFSPDSNTLASGASNGIVTVWNLEDLGPSDGIELQILSGHNGPVRSVIFHPQDPNQLISGSADHTVVLWDVEASQPTMTFSDHADEVSSVALSSDGGQLASGSADGTVKLWSMASGSLISTLTEHEEWVLSVAFDPVQNRLATGAADNTIRFWNLDTFQELYAFEGHEDWVSALSFSSNGTRLADAPHCPPDRWHRPMLLAALHSIRMGVY